MGENIQEIILSSLLYNNSIMPLFKSGYSYSTIFSELYSLEKNNYVIRSNSGERHLTQKGKDFLNNYQKKKYIILPLIEYKITPKNKFDIYLP